MYLFDWIAGKRFAFQKPLSAPFLFLSLLITDLQVTKIHWEYVISISEFNSKD